MLDKSLKNQMIEVFKSLENSIELLYKESSHSKQSELIEMLSEVAATSKKISIVQDNEESDLPFFSILKNSKPLGIHFQGIPGGHEFTSLVLSILNADHKGKLPDDIIIQRIKNLKGSHHLKTFISLDCTNCPKVVQNLNLIAIFNDEFEHTMVDGSLVQDEVKSLNILGVPSVMDGKDMISSGKIELLNLLEKLEKRFGKIESISSEKELGLYDVTVIGAGPAGVSAAIYSARKGLRVLVVGEKLGGQVQDTKGIENLISVPYIEGPQLSAKLMGHIKEYDIDFLEHRRVEKIEQGKIKKISLNTNESVESKSIIVATGAQWRKLNISGENEYIGRGVAFCPHCDGPYYKGKDIAVIGGGNSGVEAAIDLAGIVNSITLIEFAPELRADKILVDKLKSLKNVNIITNGETSKIVGDESKVTGLTYIDRETKKDIDINLDGVFIQIGLVPNSKFVEGLLELEPWGEIIIDEKCRTNQEGIYAAGDVTTVPFKQIIISMGEGSKAALTAFEELMIKT